MGTEFDFSQLSEFKKDVIKLATEIYPKDVNQFLKKEAQKQTKIVKKKVKNTIKTKTGNYLKGFKTGKVYKYDNDDCIRTYNSAPHAHLLEFGHNSRNGGRVAGRNILKDIHKEFETEFFSDVEVFIDEMLDKGL